MLTLWLTPAGWSNAQTMVTTASELPAEVDINHCHLLLPGQKDGLLPFYAKWHNVRQANSQTRRVNILHIGGSHVQAGDLSNTVRMHFEPAADRGLLFPFRAIKTNGPASYRFDYTGMWKSSRNVYVEPDARLGLSGAAAVTSDKASTLTLHLRDEGRWNFNQLIVLGQASDSTVVPYLLTTAGDTLWADPVMSQIADIQGTWVFQFSQPDSVVTLGIKGLTRTVGPKQDRKSYKPFEDKHYFALRGMMPMSDRTGVTYTESGINGASLPSWLRCTEHFEQELSLLPPDLAIFGVGINDAHVPVKDFDPEVFKENYRALIARIRSVNPDCRLLWITNNDSAMKQGRGKKARYVANKNGERVEKAMIELAEEYNGAVLDVYALMGGLGSAPNWVKAGLMQKDRIHFTRAGYQLIGDILYDAIAEDYARYFTDF